MEIGIILPSGVPGVDGRLVLEWARRADAGPFATVAVADRLAYANLDGLTTLAAVAGATERVRLMSYVVLPALRPAAVFVKEVATLAALAPARVSLGVGVGARPSDYAAVGVDWAGRGAVLDGHLEALDALRHRGDTDGDPDQNLGPDLGDLEVLIGGTSPPALARMVRWGDGFCHGGLRAEVFGFQAQAARGAWEAAGRPGSPRIVASTWYSSSTDPDDDAARWQTSYFLQGAPPEPVRDTISRGRDAVLRTVETYRAAGADELVLYPCTTALSELDWLVDVLAGAVDPVPA